MICFTEDESFVILWALGHAREAAVANDALSDAAFLDQQYELVRSRIDRTAGGSLNMVNQAVSVVEAHRRAGLSHELGGPLLQAIYDGKIPSEPDPAGGPVPWVRVADVESWAAARAS